jgi:hypothetical protein
LRFPVGGGFHAVPIGCDIGGVGANLPAAIAKLEAASVPMTANQAEEWLAALQVATAGARRSETGQELALTLYASALCRFPADVAKAVCVRLMRRTVDGKAWFPTLAEILELAERLASGRRLMLEALRRANDGFLARGDEP